MTYELWLKLATTELCPCDSKTARLDALLLLESVAKVSRAQALAYPDQLLSARQQITLEQMLQRRKNHEPIAYILGKKEFYGREYVLDHHVLVPRPETEDMISILLGLKDTKYIIDVGTGSGVIAITAKLELPNAVVYATDNDLKCLDVAKTNAKNLNANVNFIHTDIINDIKPTIIKKSVILANLPYVPESYPINLDAKYEPSKAIFSPDNGLSHYRCLFDQINSLAMPQAIICESLEQQQQELAQLAEQNGLKLAKKLGLQQLFTPKICT